MCLNQSTLVGAGGKQPEVRDGAMTVAARSANLGALGLQPGLMGNASGFVVLDYTPLELGVGRSHHESIALGKQAPPAVVAIWKTLFAAL